MAIENINHLEELAKNSSDTYNSIKDDFYFFIKNDPLDVKEISCAEAPHEMLHPGLIYSLKMKKKPPKSAAIRCMLLQYKNIIFGILLFMIDSEKNKSIEQNYMAFDNFKMIPKNDLTVH